MSLCYPNKVAEKRGGFKVEIHWLKSSWVSSTMHRTVFVDPHVHHLQKMQPHTKHTAGRLPNFSLLFIASLHSHSFQCFQFFSLLICRYVELLQLVVKPTSPGRSEKITTTQKQTRLPFLRMILGHCWKPPWLDLERKKGSARQHLHFFSMSVLFKGQWKPLSVTHWALPAFEW